jgi:DNA-binding XRE family transcriptional regulator
MNNYNIGKMIQVHRKLAGLTQLELANLAGVGKTTVFDIEKNKDTIRWNNLKSILNVLNIQVEFKGPLKSEV